MRVVLAEPPLQLLEEIAPVAEARERIVPGKLLGLPFGMFAPFDLPLELDVAPCAEGHRRDPSEQQNVDDLVELPFLVPGNEVRNLLKEIVVKPKREDGSASDDYEQIDQAIRRSAEAFAIGSPDERKFEVMSK